MKKEQIILIALIILVVLAGIQSFEIASIRSKASSGELIGYSQQKSIPSPAPSPSYGSSPMVGGC